MKNMVSYPNMKPVKARRQVDVRILSFVVNPDFAALILLFPSTIFSILKWLYFQFEVFHLKHR